MDWQLPSGDMFSGKQWHSWPDELRVAPVAPRCTAAVLLCGAEAERTPVWLMRQAGRYMAEFRAYSDKYPFRVRSETPEIAIELSLQVWLHPTQQCRTVWLVPEILFTSKHSTFSCDAAH